jgi:hypothetical protein
MIPLEINGRRQNVDVPGETPLLWTLRDELCHRVDSSFSARTVTLGAWWSSVAAT